MVVLVIFAFLGSPRATVIASLAVPISLIGSCGAMYLLGYSLNNLSLMALTIATGFVVDDAIVMIENISRHIELAKARRASGDAAPTSTRRSRRPRSSARTLTGAEAESLPKAPAHRHRGALAGARRSASRSSR